MPFAGYQDFDACVADNNDKSNPEAYCGAVKRQVEGKGSIENDYLKFYEEDREKCMTQMQEKGWNHPGFEDGYGRLSLGGGKSFFITDALSYAEINMKGDKQYYVEGYISTGDVDRFNEVVTPQAMKQMLGQLKSGNIKLDVEHSTFTGKNEIPVGKIVDAKIDEKGLWVKCVLNKAHNKFQEVWKSIQDGFLDAFSIAYKVIDVAEESINGATRKMLKALELLNVAITGNPVNPEATMTASFAKSVKAFMAMKAEEESKVSEEQKPAEEPAAAEKPSEEAPKEAPKEESKEEPKAEEEAPAEEAEAEDDSSEEEADSDEEEAAPEEEKGPDPLDTIKSLTKENKKLQAELKAMKERLEKPVMKGLAQEMPKPESNIKLKSPFELIQ